MAPDPDFDGIHAFGRHVVLVLPCLETANLKFPKNHGSTADVEPQTEIALLRILLTSVRSNTRSVIRASHISHYSPDHAMGFDSSKPVICNSVGANLVSFYAAAAARQCAGANTESALGCLAACSRRTMLAYTNSRRRCLRATSPPLLSHVFVKRPTGSREYAGGCMRPDILADKNLACFSNPVEMSNRIPKISQFCPSGTPAILECN